MSLTLTTEKTGKIPLSAIKVGTNPRKSMDNAQLDELAASIKAVGLIQPIIVRPTEDGYQVVCGHRRLAAANRAGLAEIEAVVRNYSDTDLLDTQVIENIQRADMAPLDEAVSIEAMFERGNTLEEIAATLGRSTTYVLHRRQLTHLSPKLTTGFQKGLMNVAQALVFARIASHATQDALLEETIRSKTFKEPITDSAASIAAEANRTLLRVLNGAPFKTGDDKLVPNAGACSTCQKRTGSCAALFADVDVKKQDRCLDSKCWEDKAQATVKLKLEEAKKKGYKILTEQQLSEMYRTSEWTDTDKNIYVAGKSVTAAALTKDMDANMALGVDRWGKFHEYVETAAVKTAIKLRAPKDNPRGLSKGELDQKTREKAERLQKELSALTTQALAAKAVPGAGKLGEKQDYGNLLTWLARIKASRMGADTVRNLAKGLKLEVEKNTKMPGLDYSGACAGWVETMLKKPSTQAALQVMAAIEVVETSGGWRGDEYLKPLLGSLHIDFKTTQEAVKKTLKDAKAEKAKAAPKVTKPKPAAKADQAEDEDLDGDDEGDEDE